MEPFYDDAVFGRWVRRRRRALDLTQKELARRVGCSAVMIRKLERDERRPSKGMAKALAAVLGVPPDEHTAFIRFARAGWADEPHGGTGLPPARPWWSSDGAAAGASTSEHGTARPAGVGPASAKPRSAGTTGPSEAPEVVAREAQLGRLERELGQALGGGGRTALIAGEAGQGKTTLMSAFAARAQASHPDLLVAVGTCNAYTGRGDPFLPFRQILSQLTGEAPAGPHLDAFERERGERLARMAPQVAEIVVRHGAHLLDALLPVEPLRARMEFLGAPLPGLPAAGTPPPRPGLEGVSRHDQQALRAEAASVLIAVADRAPLLLLFDDLHWLDDSSAELLLYFARAARGRPLLLVGAYRPADLAIGQSVPDPLHELARSNATTIDLDRADGRAFVDAWLDRRANALGEGFRASLWRQTAGHPLLTIELLRDMQERGDLVEDGSGVWSAAPDLPWDRLPARVADALAARM